MEITYQDVLDRKATEAAARARPAVRLPAPRFTCRRCGEHRDTTISGHCDDCEA